MPSSKPDSLTKNGLRLDQAQLAQARSHGYRLFSRLFLEGLTATLQPTIQNIPELTAVCPQPDEVNDAAARYHDLFLLNIFPFESYFLSGSGLVGGEKSAAVQQRYAQQGYQTNLVASGPDHLGQELAFLAYLTEAEAEAWATGEPAQAQQNQQRQLAFLHDHLLCWLAPCLLAVIEQGDPFFGRLAQLTLTLVFTHFEDILSSPVSPPADFLPPMVDILANDATGFKEIARHLTLPAHSGIYLSREDIGRLARRLELPRGFGPRGQMLLNLMRTAVQYEALPTLLRALQTTAQAWQNRYRQLINEHPQTTAFIHPWQNRAASTENILARLLTSSSSVK